MAVTKKGIKVNPSSGSGDTSIKFTASPANPGNRVKQTATFNAQADGVDSPVVITANLLPKAEFVSFDDGASMAVDKNGGQITIRGKTNSAMLTFSKGAGNIVADDVASIAYQANGSAATSGVAIPNDPGATAEYEFVLTLQAAENDTVKARTQTITVTCQSTSVKATITLNQTAGDPEISVEPTSVEVPQDGSEVTVQLTSNTTWTIS